MGRKLPWFRLYSEIITSPRVEMLSFEDQRHFVWILCLKNEGILDDEKMPSKEFRERVIAKKLGLDVERLKDMRVRLMDMSIIDADFQPVSWDDRQMVSDSSSERVKRYRERQKIKENNEKPQQPKDDSACNVTETAQEADTPVIETYTDVGGCDPDEAAQDFDDPPLTDADVWGAPDLSTLVENPCEPNLDEARHFLDAFGGAITFQTFDDTKQNPKLARILPGSLDDHAKTLADINAAGGGIYFAVNEQLGTGRNAESTKRVRALFADLDGAPLKPVRDFFLPPHIIVESSPGKFHAYWLVKNCPLAVFADMQKAIARRFNSDPKVCDLPRVMRVPGFCHRKGEPFPTWVIEFNEMEPYQFQRLAKVFKPAKEEKPTFTGTFQSGDWTARGVVEGQRNNTLFKRACAARAKGKDYGQIMSELMADNAACNPPLPIPEIQIIARQAVKYGVAP